MINIRRIFIGCVVLVLVVPSIWGCMKRTIPEGRIAKDYEEAPQKPTTGTVKK